MKWDVAENELPMWVADMDFQTAPDIIEALQKRVAEGVFGYTDVNDDWYQAYINWWKNRHGITIEKQWLMFCTGVIPAISSIVRKLTTPNEKVIIQTPVYNIFFNSIVNNGCRVLESPLHYEDGIYSMDFADLEEKMSDPQASLMILCNPHNPVGKIWSKEDLAKIGELAKKYGVTVVSDEIHCDLTEPALHLLRHLVFQAFRPQLFLFLIDFYVTRFGVESIPTRWQSQMYLPRTLQWLHLIMVVHGLKN